MELKKIRDGKWILDIENNKLWTNTCNLCCLECDFRCEQSCEKEFRYAECEGCELDK